MTPSSDAIAGVHPPDVLLGVSLSRRDKEEPMSGVTAFVVALTALALALVLLVAIFRSRAS
jgi:hypothetical protein